MTMLTENQGCGVGAKAWIRGPSNFGWLEPEPKIF